jgi:periplasmic protein TonB
MFDRYLQAQQRRRTRRGTLMATGSVVLHLGAVGVLVFVSLFRVEEVPPPAVTVTFFAEAAPPPPPPPPPARRSVARIERPKVEPKEIVQPPRQPLEAKPEPPPSEEEGVEGGVEGGVAGGVVGGVVGGLPSPAPPPPPARPTFVPPAVLSRQRMVGEDPPYPAAAKAAGLEATIVVKICADSSGAVTDVQIVKGHPAFDDAIVRAVRQWRYRPHTVDGKPVPICGIANFVFRLQ